MNILFKYISIIFFLIPAILFSQDKTDDKVKFLTSALLFKPTKSSIFEARNGAIKNTDNGEIRLDIGITIDVIQFKYKQIKYSAGADFITFSGLRSESNFKFPVDAIDYLFGLNFNMKKIFSPDFSVSTRFRLSHISAHLQDGHRYARADTIFKPFVYSREFIDLAGILEYSLTKNFSFRGLAAVNFIIHSIPDKFGFISFQQGIEFRYALYRYLNVYVSNDLRINSINGRIYFNENAVAGLKVGGINTTGVNLFVTYYNGMNYKGQYFDSELSYKAVGFNIDF